MNRPTPSDAFITRLLTESKSDQHPVLLGRRGYFENEGRTGQNDIGIYDDAIFLVVPGEETKAFNANTDPSSLGKKGRATLFAPQVVKFRLGTHNVSKPKDQQYRALIQAAPVIVHRFDTAEFAKGSTHPVYGTCLGGELWTNNAQVPSFGINNHRGGEFTTSSEGCQTIYKPQWPEYIAAVEAAMTRFKLDTIDYYLSAWTPAAT